MIFAWEVSVNDEMMISDRNVIRDFIFNSSFLLVIVQEQLKNKFTILQLFILFIEMLATHVVDV